MEHDPSNPLTEPVIEDPASLPAPEPMLDPLPPEEIAPPAASSANGNGARAERAPTAAEVETAILAAQGAARRAAARTASPGPVIGDLRQLATIQSDVEQIHAEAISTRRSVQLLAISLAAIAALVALYAARGMRAGAAVKGA